MFIHFHPFSRLELQFFGGKPSIFRSTHSAPGCSVASRHGDFLQLQDSLVPTHLASPVHISFRLISSLTKAVVEVDACSSHSNPDFPWSVNFLDIKNPNPGFLLKTVDAISVGFSRPILGFRILAAA